MKQVIKTIPRGWVEFKIDDLGELFNGLTGKNKSDFGVGKPYIPYMNIFSSSRININKYDFVKVKDGESQNKVKYGDIFFTTSSETPQEVGMSSVLLDVVDELYLNSFCFGLRLFNFNNLVPEFAQYIFRYQAVRKDISNLAQGSTRFNLTKRFFLNLNLVLPPVNEQKKIAEILSKVDEDIDRTEEIIKKTEKLKKGLMGELFTKGIGHQEFKKSDLGEIPVEWKVVTLKDVSSVIDSLHQTPKFSEDGFAMVRVSDIKEGFLDLKRTLKVSKEIFEEFTKKYCPQKNDIVFSRVGSYGVSSYVNTEEKFCMGQNTVVINPKINNKFLFFVLNSENIKSQIELASIGSGYRSVSLRSINDLKFGLPNKQEQKNISETLSSVNKKIEINKQIKNKLIQLKKGLMNDLLSGRVRV